MTERWQKELRKLRLLDAPGELRERVDRGPSGDGLPSTRQRVVAGVVAFGVFAGAGAFAWRALSPSGAGDAAGTGAEVPSDIPAIVPSSVPAPDASDVLRLDCAADPVVTTPVVNARRAGVRVEWTPAPGAVVWDFTSTGGGTPLQVSQYDSGGSSAPVWLPLQPGTWEVGCGRHKAELRVVDPDGLWTPFALACPAGDGSVDLQAAGPNGVSYPEEETAIRALLPLRPGDDVHAPGYPDMARDDSLPIDLRVVRDGAVVADLDLWPRSRGDPEGTGTTRVEGSACRSSGIAGS